MRNLVPTAIKVSTLEPAYNEQISDSASSDCVQESIVAAAFDVDRGLIFAASEDAQFGVRIWRTPVDPCEWNAPILCGSFASVDPKVLSLRVIGESAQLVLVTRSGDTVTWQLDDSGELISGPDVVGSVDSGILSVEWSPDDTLLVMITGDENLILMTSTFDVLSEAPLDTEDFGEDAPINVGWGAKETQFHGSIGRAHLKPSTQSPTQIQEDPSDDGLPRVSWRGDGAYFVVSSLARQTPQSGKERILRVYSNEARLQSTAENVAGLEPSLSWRPSGNLIASTQKDIRIGPSDTQRTGKHGVVFFERNGLPHGGFNLRGDDRDSRIKHLAWSSDSNVLAVHIEREHGDVVQLWTTGNYHWYLKQEISAPVSTHFTSVTWHPEVSMRLLLTSPLRIIQHDYAWETCAGANDTGCVGVIDGQKILLTPFRTQNIPPPLSSHQLLVNTPTDASCGSLFLSQVPPHISLSQSHDLLAAVWQEGHVMMWALQTRITPGGAAMNPILIWSANLPRELCHCRQVIVSSENDDDEHRTISAAILGSDVSGNDRIVIHDFEHVILPLKSILPTRSRTISLQQKNGRLVPHDVPGHLAWQAPDGSMLQVHREEESYSQICSFTEYCPSSQRVGAQLFVGLSTGGKVYIAIPNAESTSLASNVNSFTVASGFVIFTTTSHDVQFAPLENVVAILTSGQGNGMLSPNGDENKTSELASQAWQKRRVERGSRIVTAVPSTMSLVLQMPRGNLETINPRPMVMEVVKGDLDAGLWRKAFMACRKHRIDFSIIVEHNQEVFMAGIPAFVDQIEDVDYINLFLTSVGRSQLPAEVVANVCDSVRQDLEDRDLTKYINSILTAYVVKSPPDHEAGLALLLRLRDVNPSLVEEAVKYIIFLVDADRLFDTALGMYDFSLVLMVAQHAQKDPREYLPFLRELRALPKYYQHFKIDDHLKRRAKALRSLSLAGPEYFQEALDYLDIHQLHDEALAIWQGTDKYTDVLGIYGAWLFDRHEYHQAATVFVEASDARRAMISYERALQWQELFELCLKEQLDGDAITDIAYRIADELLSKKRFSESARVLLDYAKDIRQAIHSLAQGNEFAEARRIITLHAKPELVDQLLLPCALDCRAQIGDDINEMREQLCKQVARLTELRIKKVEEPDAFYNLDDPTLHNVDVMTDVSMAPTTFTRYTVAPSATSKASKRSSKTKRKMERKLGSGRKGTVDEEEYILKSVTKLVERCATTQGEIKKLLPHLLQLSKAHREEGVALQVEFDHLQSELRAAIEDIWKKPDEPTPVDSWATRMQERAKEQLVEPLQRIPRPEMSTSEWSLKLLQQKLTG
ncbi:pol II transcription elongation factor [Suillus subalutaceus]|uniref:pol II transcription elongation factor n=1 Tax=Suillus subalutaceus TaxID=48586 RepID=UPI001B868C50|nr:pol II transcription elongation factor [Suillus subalutaceus]KAG1835906.1 pol II transcription elongation factor [Suillus subalutaceus]